eukprot:m.172573 g.172573  ORF g.172573 m.172573 type:complete len:63 (+) comp18289_c0_seq3:1196-1384(+)
MIACEWVDTNAALQRRQQYFVKEADVRDDAQAAFVALDLEHFKHEALCLVQSILVVGMLLEI